MSITDSAQLIKDFFGVKIPQWWNSSTEEFVESSNTIVSFNWYEDLGI